MICKYELPPFRWVVIGIGQLREGEECVSCNKDPNLTGGWNRGDYRYRLLGGNWSSSVKGGPWRKESPIPLTDTSTVKVWRRST